MTEEKIALDSNIQHLNKMERRYQNIFNQIGNKHSAIQNLYQGLGKGRGLRVDRLGKNNLANSERDKDKMIEDFTNKQIQQYQNKVVQEEQYRKFRKDQLVKEMIKGKFLG